jgi:pimeloyl-ACP methyl ester carboxylesterase
MRTRTVDLGDVELSIAEDGVGGRQFLLLHGFTGAKEDFTDWFEPLADEGWHALAPDHRGHGGSSKPESDAAYSLSILANDALELVDSLGWAEFALLGHSMGGYVAQRIAVAAPERVRALVLMDTSHAPIGGLDPEMVAASVAIVREQGMGALADMMAGHDDPLSTPAFRRLVTERAGYAEYLDRNFRSTSPHLFAAMAHELNSDTTADLLPALGQLSPMPPTLVIVGEQDERFVAPSRRMAETMEGAELAVIEDGGHSPQFERPEAWWKALSGFLATV